MDIEFFEKICHTLDLGKLLENPKPLKGGFLHQMFSLFTTKGKYAIKCLNPHIMNREDAMKNFCVAESLEAKLEEYHLPILPALIFNGSKMQKMDGHYFYIFEWYDGKAVKNTEIEACHCETIGKFLAKIHQIDKKEWPYIHDELHIDWEFYIEQLSTNHSKLAALLSQHRLLLNKIQKKGNRAIKKMPSIMAICHNDMDTKNVLWNIEDCRIIDLECLCYASPFIELYETALCWSGFETCNINYDLLKCFIQSYLTAGGQLPNDWEVIYDSNYGRLAWLEYNLKRSLGIDCAKEEIELGVSETKKTLTQIVYYHQEKNNILHCLGDLL